MSQILIGSSPDSDNRLVQVEFAGPEFIAHGLADEQLPIETSARPHAAKLKAAGYDVSLVEFNGPHAIQPPVVALAVDFFLQDAPGSRADR